MSIRDTTEVPPEWRMVHLREYPEPLNLYGRDLFSVLGRSKQEVSKLVAKLADKTEMQTEELPGQFVTSMTGEVADEIHEWPNATLGPEFRHLVLQFREGRLVNMTWKVQGGAPSRNKPWWRFW